VFLIGAGSGVVPLMAMIRYRKASGEPVPVALLLSSRTYKSRSSFLRAFRQVHAYVPAESEGNGQNSD
jgi:ferredoxin-NADP reductase